MSSKFELIEHQSTHVQGTKHEQQSPNSIEMNVQSDDVDQVDGKGQQSDDVDQVDGKGQQQSISTKSSDCEPILKLMVLESVWENESHNSSFVQSTACCFNLN